MRIGVRPARVVALLILVIVLPLAVTSVASRFTGDRVYLVNSTPCRVVVMEQHDGHEANPGETVLIKSGFLDRTPTMMVFSGSAFLFGGLHFTMNTLQVRDQADIAIPPSWLSSSITGKELTYELTADGQLLVKGPTTQSSMPQPKGLPLKTRATPDSTQCRRG